MRLRQDIARIEYKLSWQGADPRIIDKKELREVCNQPLYEDAVEDKYRERIKNPATAIRAYCVECMGGSVSGVKDCTSMTCPLWNFRMGKDPLRGYELPPYVEPISDIVSPDDEDDTDSELFADEDDDNDEDAED